MRINSTTLTSVQVTQVASALPVSARSGLLHPMSPLPPEDRRAHTGDFQSSCPTLCQRCCNAHLPAAQLGHHTHHEPRLSRGGMAADLQDCTHCVASLGRPPSSTVQTGRPLLSCGLRLGSHSRSAPNPAPMKGRQVPCISAQHPEPMSQTAALQTFRDPSTSSFK